MFGVFVFCLDIWIYNFLFNFIVCLFFFFWIYLFDRNLRILNLLDFDIFLKFILNIFNYIVYKNY